MYPVLFHIGPIVVPSYGVMAALGMLLALALLLRTARFVHLNPNPLWNLCIVALFAALIGSRLLLLALNWSVVRTHPAWLLGLAMMHHPLLAGVGAACAIAVAFPYALAQHLPLRDAADALSAPVALGLACEQFGALLAGSGYGTETDARWAIVYTNPFAARWSGAPLFDAVHPVQAYAALAFLVVSVALYFLIPRLRRPGDAAGVAMIAIGVVVYFTEFFRDPEGRGSILGGAIDGPQIAVIGLVLLGALLLCGRTEKRSSEPIQAPDLSTHASEASHD